MSVAKHFGWSEEETLFRLEHSVVDSAQYVLMDVPNVASVAEFVEVMRQRFGSVASAEQYRVELGRLRRGSMSLQELHLEVRRLVNKAFPGCWSKSTEIYARDAFLTALDDWELRRRIIMAIPPPETLAAAYDLAVRAITVEDVGRRGDRSMSDCAASRGPPHRARVLAEDETAGGQAAQQQATIDELRKQVADLKMTVTALGRTQRQSMEPEAGAGAQRVTEGVCWRCGQPGHWARRCPQGKKKSNQSASSEHVTRNSMLSGKQKTPAKVYVEILYRGQPYRALLDTGCDISVISSRALPGLPYEQGRRNMLAANLSPVPILGSATVGFTLAGVELQHKFLVSDAIEEIILGSDWLVANRCRWDFDEGLLWLRSTPEPVQVRLISSGVRRCVRRIYARSTVELQPGTQTDVIGKSVWSMLPPASVTWAVEPKELQPGVLTARTLLSADEEAVRVRVINWGAAPCTVTAGELLASAEPVEVCAERTSRTEPCVDRAHVQCLIDALPSELSDDQRKQATDFIGSYAHVFSSSAMDLGRNRMMPHRIYTKDDAPIRQPLRRQPFAYLPEIERNVQELLAAGVIEPAQSPWSSNVCLVKKKDDP